MTATVPRPPESGEASFVLVDLKAKIRHRLGERTTIGRDGGSTIRLTDPMVSSWHAELCLEADGRLRVVDLKSRNGVFVAGRRVSEATLAPGEELLVGIVRFRFERERSRARVETPLRLASSEDGPVRLRNLTLRREPDFRRASDIPDQDQLKRDYERLRAAVELTRKLAVEHDVGAVLEQVVEAAVRLFDADQGAVILVDAAGHPALQVGRDRDGSPVESTASTTALSEIIATRAAVLLSDTVVGEPASRTASIVARGIRARLSAPLSFGSELLGVVQVDSLGSGGAFGERDLELFATLAQHAALAIKNAQLAQAVQSVQAENWRRLERVVAGLPSGVLLLDAERRVVLANAAGEAILPALGGRVGEVLDRLGDTSIEVVLASATGRPLVIALGDNPPRHVEVSVRAPAPGAALATETVVLVRDVSEERAREDQEAQRHRLALVGQLAGGVAHDFNNLMAVVLSYAEFVGDCVTEESVRADVEEIRLAALRATDITKQLLAFSRRDVVDPRPLEVTALVEGMHNLLSRTVGGTIRLKLVHAAALPAVKADATRLEQVLLNLVVNARDAMPNGGELVITTGVAELTEETAASQGLAPGRYVTIVVEDTGSGMSRDVAARVFEPFFTTKERGKGTGLGLATAYGIVKQAGGNLVVRSTPGAGTAFTISLPASAARASARAIAPPVRRRLAGGTVLLAEDEPAVRGLARRILVEAGFEVIDAADGQEALARAGSHPGRIDLLLTDLVMPGMSGKRLAEHLRASRPEVEVIFMSGYVDDASLDRDVRDREARFIAKPFTREALIDRIAAALAIA